MCPAVSKVPKICNIDGRKAKSFPKRAPQVPVTDESMIDLITEWHKSREHLALSSAYSLLPLPLYNVTYSTLL